METTNEQLENLIEINDELENYFRNTIIPQLYIDSDLILRKFTPPAMKQFSLSRGDVGKFIGDIKDNFRYPSIIENIELVMSTNEILEKEIQTSDFRWYQMNIIPYLLGKEKKTDGVIVTFVEITMRVRDLKDLEKIIADHEILLDIISHDIKTPLTSLLISVNLLKNVSPEKPENFKPILQIVENSIVKMKDIIYELTDTRKQEHKYKSEEEILNIEHVLEDVRLAMKEIIEESKAKIRYEINISQLTFNRRKLRSVIYNLVNNAIKYKSQDRQPEICIKTERDDNYFILSITDNGVGIEENKQDQIFSKYFRLENNIPGSGIGLYLVNEIVKNTGGKITVESQKGIGSTFKVFLQGDLDLKNDPKVMEATLEKSKIEIPKDEDMMPG
jgi:two-component system phosphate regulon sensor histidine kinase PhoR